MTYSLYIKFANYNEWQKCNRHHIPIAELPHIYSAYVEATESTGCKASIMAIPDFETVT